MTEIRQVYGDDADIWLFGSRVDDNARGGDIDLYVETADDTNRLDRYLQVRQRLFRLFGDRKIDLLVRSRQRLASPIERIARKTGQKLSAVGQGRGQERQG
ncbi:MAG: nucleotidyltransferase domain-containing protein [Nodosilinea sp.]